jgi:hypothetical protein
VALQGGIVVLRVLKSPKSRRKGGSLSLQHMKALSGVAELWCLLWSLLWIRDMVCIDFSEVKEDLRAKKNGGLYCGIGMYLCRFLW